MKRLVLANKDLDGNFLIAGFEEYANATWQMYDLDAKGEGYNLLEPVCKTDKTPWSEDTDLWPEEHCVAFSWDNPDRWPTAEEIMEQNVTFFL
jgi:hypothetical protein